MAIIKCAVCNRFYDDITDQTCPYCSNKFVFDLSDEVDRNSKTVALDTNELEEIGKTPSQNDVKTQAYLDDVEENDKTIGIFFQEEDYNPITAWLVCIEGTVKGKSYEVHMNRNFLGRDKLMDISIPDDLQISRKNHLSITYDNKSNAFFAKGEEGLLYINSKPCDKATMLNENDILSFGESKYIFVPYCNEERNWNKPDEKNDD